MFLSDHGELAWTVAYEISPSDSFTTKVLLITTACCSEARNSCSIKIFTNVDTWLVLCCGLHWQRAATDQVDMKTDTVLHEINVVSTEISKTGYDIDFISPPKQLNCLGIFVQLAWF